MDVRLHPKIAIYLVKQLKNDSYRRGLYQGRVPTSKFGKSENHRMIHRHVIHSMNNTDAKKTI